ncbi:MULTISPECIES: NAD(P)-dependent alcohol dehydrogenase [unclassified Campylobacter]|uniref:NAD(P)-dependent alcohol dehydrogenase n=1 Tax=unclassified Campylobacter TaxID=2593542 RepID=UPI001E06F393|nr:NAD(P)-dependent alcohol dehydrogenase [Campylobacter sp. RM9331]MBZ8005094.1 NAD(P)-dependent alcohol dehydrogenase [Campylobacter sp. RM9332]
MSEIITKGFAAYDENANFKPITFKRSALRDDEILIKTMYCGICHSDIHAAKNEWKATKYPIVPGHEIVGLVVEIGKNVKEFEIGNYAGIGCLINSCGECDACLNSNEQFCQKGAVWTYNSVDYFNNSEITKGGYSNYIKVHKNYAIKVPNNAPLKLIAPLFCAGITTYSPLKFSKVSKGMDVAIAGFGGLGVMAFKYAKAMGANVSVIARNDTKKEAAIKLGASNYYNDINKVDKKFDVIISTIPSKYDVLAYARTLKYGGEMAIVGLPPINEQVSISLNALIRVSHKKIYGSLIGGIKETKEMLEFSLKHSIYPEVKIIKPDEINKAYDDLLNNSNSFRYVIDFNE